MTVVNILIAAAVLGLMGLLFGLLLILVNALSNKSKKKGAAA